MRYPTIKKKKIEKEKSKPIFYKGKRIHTYTLPIGSKGGLFSKTYVRIDEKNILNLRFQMISPNDLWQKKAS